MREKKLFVLAGEVSGDLHASEVIAAVHATCPGVKVFGAGGRTLRGLGVELLYHVDDLGVMGFAEVFGKGLFLQKVLRDLKRLIEREKPDAALLVDYPGMNLLIARHLHRLGIPVIYYISPKVWAWKEGRAKKIRETVDHLMVIFDFEVEFYQKHSVEAEFVGNPVAEEITRLALPSKKEFLGKNGIAEETKIIGLLPGSRTQEISLILPEMLKASKMLAEKYKTVFLLGKAPHVNSRFYDHFTEGAPTVLVDCTAYEVMQYCDLLLVTSGTATLEALCFGTPMIVLYKTGRLNYFIGKRLVRLNSISLANLVTKGIRSKERTVPELIQHEMNPENIFHEASRLLDDANKAERMRRQLLSAKEKLGSVSPSNAVASVLCRYL